MPTRRLHRRVGLVGLGALQLVLVLAICWPAICVAAIPVPPSPPMLSLLAAVMQAPPSTTANRSTTIGEFQRVVLKPAATPSISSRPNNSSTSSSSNSSSSSSSRSSSNLSSSSSSNSSSSSIISDYSNERRRRALITEVNADGSVQMSSINRNNSNSNSSKELQSITNATHANASTNALNIATDIHRANDVSSSAPHEEAIGAPPQFDDDVIVLDATESETLEATSTAMTVMVQQQQPPAKHQRRSVSGAPSRPDRSASGAQQAHNQQHQHQSTTTTAGAATGGGSHGGNVVSRKRNANLDRNERSANISHLMGTARKIQILMKNRLIQLLPDGTVNGTQDDQSDYTILQRGTVNIGQVRIQAVATCLFLCMDACGNIYSAKDFTDDCVFNETMQENYNIYSSTHHSTAQRTYYLALNKMGQPRRTHLPAGKELGKLATYAKSLTFTVPDSRSSALLSRLFGANHVRHGLKQLCDGGKSLTELTRKTMQLRPVCAVGGVQLTTTTALGLAAASASAKHPRNKNGKQSGLSHRGRRPGQAARCAALENCQPRRRNNQPNSKVDSAAGETGNQRLAKPGGVKPGAKKHIANGKKGHRRKKLVPDLTTSSSTSTTTTASPTLPTTTAETTSGAEEETTEQATVVSSTEAFGDEANSSDDDQWEQSSAPSTGITAFVEDGNDEFDV